MQGEEQRSPGLTTPLQRGGIPRSVSPRFMTNGAASVTGLHDYIETQVRRRVCKHTIM